MKKPEDNTRISSKRRMQWCIASVAVCLLAIALVVPLWLSKGAPNPKSEEYVANAAPARIVSESSAAAVSDEPTYDEEPELTVISDGEDGIAAEHEAGVVLVQLADGTSADDLNTALSQVDCVQSVTITDDDVMLGFVELPLAEGYSVQQAMSLLQALPVVQASQPNYIYHVADDWPADLTVATIDENTEDQQGNQPTAKTNDKLIDKQWALDSVEAFDAWETVKCEGRTTVAVLDTGCLLTHEDLKNNVVTAYDATGANSVYDGSGHGTHVCGIIAAEANNGLGVAGVSYNAGILPIKVFVGTNASTAHLVKAYDFILKNASYYNIRVANVSLGVDVDTTQYNIEDYDEKDQALYKAVKKANDEAGVLTVCSSGNDADTKGGPYLNFPSDYLNMAMNVIAVQPGAQKTDPPVRAAYSNYNMEGQTAKDISAPGGESGGTAVENRIASTYINNGKTDAYGYLSGTSMAAPCVSGIAALLFAANPNLTPDQVKAILHDSATDLGSTGWDEGYGYGEVNAKNAVSESELGLFLDGDSSLLVGGSCTLTPSDAGQWSFASNNPNVATVDDTGNVTGVAGGSTVITATRSRNNKQEQVSRTITVYDISFTGPTQVWTGESIVLQFNENPDTGMWLIGSTDNGILNVNVNGDVTVTGLQEGTAKVQATLASNKKLEIEWDVEVLKERIDFSAARVTMSGWTYDGTQHEPSVTVTLNGQTLDKSAYTVEYANNKDAGICTATVTPTDTENYKNVATGRCRVATRPVTLTSASANKEYDGTALTSTAVTVGGSGFIPGEVSNVRATGSITNVGTVMNTIAFTSGIGYKASNYSITKNEGRLSVAATSISNANVAAIAAQTYTGNAIEPTPTITWKNRTLANNNDYTLSYSGNVNPGTATVTITGKDNFTGSMQRTFTIDKASVSSVTLSQTAFTYDGSAKRPNATVKGSSGRALSAESDYNLTYSNNINAGTATVTATGTSNYKGTASATFSIARASLSSIQLSQTTYMYDGSAKTPSAIVRGSNGKTLAEGTEYSLAYTNNVNAGTGTATATGTGNYMGTVRATFSIQAPAIEPEPAPEPEPVVEPAPMHRLYNPHSGEHFYTHDDEEHAYLVEAGWQDEGEGWDSPAFSSSPVYRLYNPHVGDHHYTLDVNERNYLASAGWNDEGIAWYSDDNHGVPLYRLYNPNAKKGSHHYTLDANERDYLVELGWNDEGISWYGLA